MKIIRAEYSDTDIFSKNQLTFGGCCFYPEDRSAGYFFKIDGVNATLFTDEYRNIDEVIEEFLFYSGFISSIEGSDGKILYERKAAALELSDISMIQPSQFYVNIRKLSACKSWITHNRDVMIPSAEINGRIVALDGHTRLRAAHDLGYTHAYIYRENYDKCILHFVNEAVNRGITNIFDMELISDEEYHLKWHKYCDDFFATPERD